jgi:hypothetical protein
MEFLMSAGGAIVAAFCGVLWWLFRKVEAKVEDGAKDLADYKLYVAEKYVNHNDLADAMQGVKEVMGSMLKSLDNIQSDMKAFTNRIYDKLDTKVDKGSQ